MIAIEFVTCRFGRSCGRVESSTPTPGQGKGLPIKDFPVEASVGGPVTVEPWGVSHTFARSFVTSSRGLLRARRGSAREPIRTLRGPAPAKELVKDQSAAVFEAGVRAIVEPIVTRRLARLM